MTINKETIITKDFDCLLPEVQPRRITKAINRNCFEFFVDIAIV